MLSTTPTTAPTGTRTAPAEHHFAYPTVRPLPRPAAQAALPQRTW
jgi:hypothetical protein